MKIIRVVVTGSAVEGRFPYRIETENTRLGNIVNGLSATPLLDSCRTLQKLGAAADNAMIGLFYPLTNEWRMRTTVGYGARYTVEETATRPKFVPYVPMPPEEVARRRALQSTPAPTVDALKTSEGTEIAPEPEKRSSDRGGEEETASGEESTPAIHPSGAKTARSEAAPPRPRKPPVSLAGKDRDQPEPPKPGPTHHKRKRAGSSARQGRR